MKKIQSLINHISFAIDASSSMSGLTKEVIALFDNQVQYLASRSKELNQETRVSVYLFGSTVTNLIFDMDVMRLPSLQGFYAASGMTALIDGTLQAIEDFNLFSEKYGDHAFLSYVITDGGENQSKHSSQDLINALKGLKDNWTVAALVPNQNGVYEAKKFGFPADNISIWDVTSAKGVQEVGNKIKAATESYFRARASGIRSTKSLFTIDTSNLNKTQINKKLDELNPSEYDLLPVRQDAVIKAYVESWTGKPYRVGSAYFQLSKPEKIQANKQIAVKNKLDGKIYSGLNARTLLKLPDYEIKVKPSDFGSYEIFCQSSSVNRKLIKGTELLVLK